MSQAVVAPLPQVVWNNVPKVIFNNLGIIYLQKSFLMNQISLNTSMRGYRYLSINYSIRVYCVVEVSIGTNTMEARFAGDMKEEMP